LGRLSQIVTAGRGADQTVAPFPDAKVETKTDAKKTDAKKTDAKSVAAAAQAFAERLRTKVHGLAA
jgi:hypothetical protein